MQYRPWCVYFNGNSHTVFWLKLRVACFKSSPHNIWVWDYWLRPSLCRTHFKTHSDQPEMRGLKCCDISYLGNCSVADWVGFIYLFTFIVFISKYVEQEITDCLVIMAPDANFDRSRFKFSLKMGMLAICRPTYRSDFANNLPYRSTLSIM